MRSIANLALAAVILCLSTGCGILRSIEQWKCDHLGMCHFGIQPSHSANVDGGCCNSNPAACPPPTMMMHTPVPSMPMGQMQFPDMPQSEMPLPGAPLQPSFDPYQSF